jgi:hypothetical protein
MREFGVCAVSSANPKLTHGAEIQTSHAVEALVACPALTAPEGRGSKNV